MSTDYNLNVVYGQVITSKQSEALTALARDFGGNYITSARDVLMFSLEQDFYARYPSLSCIVNNDQVSGQLPQALVIYTRSSLISLDLRYGGEGVHQQFPLRFDKMAVDAEQVDQLRQFCTDYDLAPNFGWTVVASIS